jgi:hypothetical protein
MCRMIVISLAVLITSMMVFNPADAETQQFATLSPHSRELWAKVPLPTNMPWLQKHPSTLNNAPEPDPGAYSPQLEARSLRMFPWASQEQQRQQWMADQEQRAIANDINRSKSLLYPVSGR